MAKRTTVGSKEVNYKLDRIRQPMDRSKLNEICKELKSDDDFVNYHLDLVENTPKKYMIAVMNDEATSPKKGDSENRSYAFMKPLDALDFVNEYIDEGKANSKPKEVMRSGYNKKSQDKYKALVEQEALEAKAVNSFTKPSFDDVMNNVYVNTFNGETYHQKDEDIPDDLRDDVGVIIPGLIETTEEYFEFVKRLKDKGKGGLGRSIYERYEDYEEAVELIEQYKEAVYNKYGGKDNYYEAKEIGGFFGGYEFMPTVKPRFKKTKRNIKLDRGINLNELASVKDMGARIRAEIDSEVSSIDVDYTYNEFETTPPKFKDLPEDLKLLYKNDKYGKNGFDIIKKFKKLEQYANELIRSGNDPDVAEGYRLLDLLSKERVMNTEIYESTFSDILDDSNDDINYVINQLDYDKLIDYYGVIEADNMYDSSDSREAFMKYMKKYIEEIHGLDYDNPMDRVKITDFAEYATNYMFNSRFRQIEDDKAQINSAGDVLYSNNKNVSNKFFGSEERRENVRANENKIQAYVRSIASAARDSLERLNSNADTVGYSGTPTMDISDITSYNSTIDTMTNGFDLTPNAKSLAKYMVNNEALAKRIYELSADKTDEGMFSMRTNIDEFTNKATEATKPFMTDKMIDMVTENKKRGVKLDE